VAKTVAAPQADPEDGKALLSGISVESARIVDLGADLRHGASLSPGCSKKIPSTAVNG
jgi:hypothetical protein